MKNKTQQTTGWLDNFNDSKVSLPPGFVGEGTFNGPQWESPAWGGQFQEGGEIPNAQNGTKKPVYVESTNDPRYRAYNDSLSLYEGTKDISKLLHNRPISGRWEKSKEKIDPKLIKKIVKTKSYSQLSPDEKNEEDRRIKESLNPNIKPYKYEDYLGEGPRYKESHFFSPDTYSKEKVYYEDFKSPNFFYKKPQQQVIVKDSDSPIDETKDVPVKRTKIKAIQNNLQPEGLVHCDLDINADISGLHPDVRRAKYYDIQENINQPFGGSQTNYRISDLSNITSPDDLGPGNTRKITPQYQMGGSVYPVNYVPQAQDGTSEDAMRGMMKSKIGMGNVFGNPAIKRMSQAMPKTGMTPEGQGTHYMSSVDNYAVPLLQDFGEEELTLIDPDSRSREAIRFNSPEEAEYFAEHYKEVAPMSTIYKGLQEYAMGGSIPGAVGFSYARTQGAAPSNGKYAKKTMASAQNGQEMQYYQNGLDFQPKTISKDGSVIKDNNGYWNPDNWGKPVEIGSNDITMEGVYEPLLGVSDTGDTKLMKPGKNYKFKGKKVTEYPMAKNGRRQEQKGLQNLDNLINFTNYNKPTIGGWLNKYN
jgi:hypothetical protein